MFLRTLLPAVVATLICHTACADSAFEPLVGFEMGPNPTGGTVPWRPALYLHSNGNFYGTTHGGGAFGFGTLFQMSKSGQLGHLSFTDLNAGSVPTGRHPGSAPMSTLVLSSDGWLWGTTSAGGVNSTYGTIFRIRPETGEFQTMHNFASGTNGNSPAAGLVSDGQGYLWGMTRYTNNGTSTHGTLFRIHELTGVFERRLTFASTVAPKGRVPEGNLYYDGAGNLWGTTSKGSTYSCGTIFKYTISNNTLTTLSDFSDRQVQAGAIKGNEVAATLVPDGAGFLWGVTTAGGDISGYGTVFKVEMATGTATTVLEFSNNGTNNKGANPVGPLVNDGAGNLWGVTRVGAASGEGSIFKIASSTGVLTTVLQFGNLTGVNASVSTPFSGLTNDGQGNLWGYSSAGGAAATWAVFKIKMSDGSFTKVAEHAPGGVSYHGRTPLAGLSGNDTSPWLWGTTSVGGTSNLGTLYRYDPSTGQHQTVIHFTGQTGTALGSKPNGKVHVDADGVVWGTTEEGGTGGGIGYGTVFKYDPATSTFTTVQAFTAGGGYRPRGALVGMSDGFIWGTTSSGSSASYGSVFKINPATNALTVVHTFASSTPANGYQLACGLVEDSSGFIWGTTQLGGANTSGTLFKIEMVTGAMTVAHSFPNGSGNHAGNLVIDAEDNIYGTNPLSVFKFVPGTSTYTAIFTNEDITIPLKSVAVGTLYKTAAGEIRFQGTEGTRDLTGMSSPYNNYTSYRAVIYEIDTTTHVVTKVQSLMESIVGTTVPAALAPAGGLYEHTDGRFYGVSQSGGTNEDLEPAGGGMIYRVGSGPAAIAQPYSTLVSLTYSQYSSATGNTTLRGFVNPNGNSILCEFEWGPTTNLGNTITASATPGTGFTGNLCEAVLPGLPANTTYFFRLRANTNGLPDEPSLGPIQSIVTGTPAGPTNAEISVESPIGQLLTDNTSTLDLGSLRVAQSVKQAVTVRNISLSNSLTGLSAGITGTNASDFVITTPLTLTSVGPGGSDGLLITFTPSDSGPRAATLTIASNDGDEASFEIQLTGEGIVEPEIEVDAPGPLALENGHSFDFGTSAINSGTARTFTIRNTGNAPLSGLDVSITGMNSGDFAVTTQPGTEVAASGSTTFVITFTPSAGGARSATIEIANDDGDENPFHIQVSGTGITAPEIEVLDGATNLTDNSSTIDFGAVSLGSSPAKTITVRNSGNATLTGISASIISGDTADFTASGLTSSVTAGNETTFTLTFTPQNVGTRTATLRIASNDADENPFDITVTGSLAVPQGPVFTVQPMSRLAFLGGPAAFDSTVTGDPVMTYRWKKGTAFIANATASNYIILATKAADVGAYSVIADNPVGAEVPSSTAYLGLVTLSHSQQVLKVGSTLKLTCTVAAPKLPGVTVKYDWFRQGSVDPITNGAKANLAVVSGATTGALSIAKIGTADADTYMCRVTLDTPGNDPQLFNGSTMVFVVDAVPDVAAMPPESVSVSEPIDITIIATNFPTSFSASALPAGLKFDTKTGRLTGKPTTPSKKTTLGAYIPSKISFKATNPFGTSLAEDFFLTIEPLEDGVVGTFSGIVERSNHSNFGMGGHVKITVASTGVVSGDVTLAGQKHAVVGSINVSLGNNPTFDLIIKRNPASLGDLRLTGGISPPDDLFSGDISDPRFEMLTGTQDLGDPAEPGLVNGTMAEARFNSPSGLALLANGSGYISDLANHTIRFVDGDGETVSTFAGSTTLGSNDGTGTAASFAGPEGLALDSAGNLFVADTLNSTIRKITPTGVVTTFAGTAGQVGAVNGTGAAARFDLPCALCFDPAGNLYVADRGNHTIRKITPAGVVTTLAGKADQSGHKDGSGASALFSAPRGIVYEPVLKALFVTDSENVVIRKVTLTGATTTYAGSPGAGGIADGLFANARFIDPRGITTLGDGTLIVTDTLLVQLNPNGTLGTISDYVDTVGRLDHPVAVAYNPADESLITMDDVLHGAISYEPSGVNQEAHFAAQRAPWTTTNFVPAAEQGLYNAALETTVLPTNNSFPQGDGYAQVAISKSGVAAWSGKAADGTSFTFSTFMADDRSIPLHAMLYKNTGSLQGETFITPAVTPNKYDLIGDNTPAFDWYKLNQPLASTDRSYKGGFPVHDVTLTGGKYVPNDLHLYLGFAPTPALANMQLSFTESLINPFVQAFTLTKPNTVVVPSNAKTLTMKIDPKTGIFTGSFKEGTPAATVPFAGILIDYDAGSDQSGHGHYLIPESASATSQIHSARVLLGAD